MTLRATALLFALSSLPFAVSACDAGESSMGQGGATTNGGSTAQGGSSSGQGGASPGAGGQVPGGGPTMKPASTYTFNTPGAKFPFPQGKASATCKFPSYNTDQVATAYQNWKTKFVVGGRVIRPENNNDTVSEGIAYAMLIGVYMNDKPLFDSMWTYAKAHFNGNGLMNWRIDANNSTVGNGSASDADLDMAWALTMANTQWGGSYGADATTLLNNLWNKEVEMGSFVLKPGDNFGGSDITNPSYFAQSYYRAFAKVSPHNWKAVYDKSYQILAASTGNFGLVPNWVNASGAGVNGPGNDPNGLHFGYDASRTPFRIALDYCQSGEPRAKAYLDKILAFYGSKLVTNLSQLRDGYTVSGTDPSGTLGDYGAGMVFFGPAGVAAMAGGQDNLLLLAHGTLAAQTTTPSTVSNANIFNYYQGSWGVLSLLAMSGNFWDMTQP